MTYESARQVCVVAVLGRGVGVSGSGPKAVEESGAETRE